MLMGFFVALLNMLLFSLGFLPGFVRGQQDAASASSGKEEVFWSSCLVLLDLLFSALLKGPFYCFFVGFLGILSKSKVGVWEVASLEL